MDFLLVSTTLLTLFAIIGLGFLLRRVSVLDAARVRGLSHILVNIALPALTISSMQVPLSPATLDTARTMLIVAIAYYLGAFFLSWLICRMIPSSDGERGIFRFMLVFPNVGFMGIPVAAALLGPGSLFYVILFCLPFNLFAFTLGVYLVAGGSTRKKFNPLVLLTPGLIASFIGLALFLTGTLIPEPANSVLGWAGMTVTPLAMLVVGAHLATLPLRNLAGDRRIALIGVFRLLVLPVLAFLVLVPLVQDRLLLEVAVLLIAMPVAANAVLFAEEYGADATPASQGVFLTTLCCIATIPLLLVLLF